MVSWQAARERAHELGLKAEYFTSELARQHADELLAEQPMSDAVREALGRRESGLMPWRTALWLSSQEPDHGTTNELHAILAIDAYAREWGHEALARTFAWAADRVRLGEFAPRDRDEIEALLDLAGIPRRRGVAA